MRHVIFKNSFKKQYELFRRRGKDIKKLEAVIKLLAHDEPMPSSYKDHPLSGNFSGFRDCHIEPDWLLIYAKEPSEDKLGTLYLEATGTHSDLF